MEFLDSTGHAVQLILALVMAVALFILASAGYARVLLLGLIVMIPFQPIDSKFGSINMAATYVVAIAMLFNNFRHSSGLNFRAPLLVPFSLLLLAFFISWSLAPRLFSTKYLFYLVQMGSNIALFYMSYSFFKKSHDLEMFFRALIFSNVLVVLYSLIQLFVGTGQLSLFGMSELSLQANRSDQRLVGPFHAVGITAEYLVIQSLVLAHYIVQTGKLRKIGPILLLGNIAILVGTGNRGGFISALLAAALFLYVYKRYIGGRGVLLASLGFVFLLGTSSFVMVKYTNYNVLFTRLLSTEFDGVRPDTRLGWTYVVEKIMDSPVAGHGPRIVQPAEFGTSRMNWPDEYITFYPHSLYLFILYTTGIIGFLAYVVWAATYWRLLCRERRRGRFTRGIGLGLPTLGMIIFVIFLIDQLKVEFLRFYLLDYQHFLAALFGMFAAHGNIHTDENPNPKSHVRKGLLTNNA